MPASARDLATILAPRHGRQGRLSRSICGISFSSSSVISRAQVFPGVIFPEDGSEHIADLTDRGIGPNRFETGGDQIVLALCHLPNIPQRLLDGPVVPFFFHLRQALDLLLLEGRIDPEGAAGGVRVRPELVDADGNPVSPFEFTLPLDRPIVDGGDVVAVFDGGDGPPISWTFRYSFRISVSIWPVRVSIK